MAENKKSFLLYADYLHTFEELTDEEAGLLIKHLLAYVNDKSPETDNRIIKIAFEPIKQQLKRDLKHWDTIKQKRSNAGKASVESKKQTSTDSTHVNTCQQESTNSTVNVTDTVNVTVTDTVIESNTGAPKNPLLESNLFRKPKIPTFDKVHYSFLQSGGTQEMAKAFFDKYEALGWFLNNTPIDNYSNLVGSFIRIWKENEKKKFNKGPDVKEPTREELLQHAQSIANRYS